MRRAMVPLAAALLGLVGSLVATLVLHRAGSAALDRVLDERLRGTGEAASLLLADRTPDDAQLRALMKANHLDGVYVLDPALKLVADAGGQSGRRVDLLRVDSARVQEAFEGRASAGYTYFVGDSSIAAGYFPVRSADGSIASVLALEAGQAFAGDARAELDRARWLGVALALVAALALAAVATGFVRAEQHRREAAERIARADMLSRMAAAAAHDIRNPLGVIRGTVELTRQRAGANLSPRDHAALDDILGEVERLKQLTEDFLDLAADRPLAKQRVSIADVLEDAAKATEANHPQIKVDREIGALPAVDGDAGRLGQVFRNLLANAAEAQVSGKVRLVTTSEAGFAIVRVVDTGPGVPAELLGRLFEPFVTMGKTGGTGLGLAICKRLVERQGGRLALLPSPPPGATFEVRLPAAES